MADLPTLKIFLSSPGDVAEERALAEFVFRRIADEVSDAANLTFLIWEHEPLFGHTGFQQQIERPSQSDLVVCILWSRLGTRLPSDFAPAKGEPPPTGTEFEIKDALASYAERGKPNLLIYRKVPGPQIGLGSANFAERSDQYRRLDEFCRRTFYNRRRRSGRRPPQVHQQPRFRAPPRRARAALAGSRDARAAFGQIPSVLAGRVAVSRLAVLRGGAPCGVFRPFGSHQRSDAAHPRDRDRGGGGRRARGQTAVGAGHERLGQDVIVQGRLAAAAGSAARRGDCPMDHRPFASVRVRPADARTRRARRSGLATVRTRARD